MKKRTEGQRRRRWKRRRRRGRGESQVPVPLSHGEMHRKYGLRERQSERGFRSGERERRRALSRREREKEICRGRLLSPGDENGNKKQNKRVFRSGISSRNRIALGASEGTREQWSERDRERKGGRERKGEQPLMLPAPMKLSCGCICRYFACMST